MSKLVLLKTDADFERFKLGRSYQTSLLKIRIHSPLRQNFPRFGFIIPKKVLPRAKNRNTIKRRLKNILSKVADRVKPVDVLLFPKSQALKIKFSDLEREVIVILGIAKIWK
jgi:ribonuclease P protein component